MVIARATCSLLRTLIHIAPDDRTRLAIDRPSGIFAGFAAPAFVKLGTALDRQLAGLLKTLGV